MKLADLSVMDRKAPWAVMSNSTRPLPIAIVFPIQMNIGVSLQELVRLCGIEGTV